MMNAREKELLRYEEKCENGLKMVNALLGKIEDMKLDCDYEVYERLLKIADELGR